MYKNKGRKLNRSSARKMNSYRNRYDDNFVKVDKKTSQKLKNSKKPSFLKEVNELDLNQSYYNDLNTYAQYGSLEGPMERRSLFFDKFRKNKSHEDALMGLFCKNGVKLYSNEEFALLLDKVKKNFSWSPGFSLQLGTKGRKIMLQLIRMAYKSSKKNKRIFTSKQPPVTISNLPFFKISMLWEIANDLGVFEHAVLVHGLFATPSKQFKLKFNGSLADGLSLVVEDKRTTTGSTKNKKTGYTNMNSYIPPDVHYPYSSIYSNNCDILRREDPPTPNDSNRLSSILDKDDFISSINDPFNDPLSYVYPSSMKDLYQPCIGEDYSNPYRGSYTPIEERPLEDASGNDADLFVQRKGQGVNFPSLNNSLENNNAKFKRIGRLTKGNLSWNSRHYHYNNYDFIEDSEFLMSPGSLSTDVPSIIDNHINDDEIVFTESNFKQVSNSPGYLEEFSYSKLPF